MIGLIIEGTVPASLQARPASVGARSPSPTSGRLGGPAGFDRVKHMSNSKNYYETLQVDPAAEQEVIEAAYRRLARKYHPDTNKSPNAKTMMQEFNEAYAVLRDPATRAVYDSKLRVQATESNPRRNSQQQPKEGEAPRDAEESRRKRQTEQRKREQTGREEYFRRLKLTYVTCPRCGEDNPTNTFLCSHCGHNLPSAEPIADEKRVRDQQPGQALRFLTCPRCGEQSSARNMHCVHCGQRLSR